tara:strand:- start:171291 stop:172967 length:1677 start_codon:yes stop_codon:yes gene_type:complete
MGCEDVDLSSETVSFVDLGAPTAERLPQERARPNILLIVLDDLGFNDLGYFGSEIETPNIDALARDGLVLTSFHTAPTCSPTRSMLLTGTDSHVVGLGTMAEVIRPGETPKPGYEGYLNSNAATLPELLRDSGYNTYMTGKWHLGLTRETSASARGFDKSFILARGGAGAFHNQLPMFVGQPTLYRENGEQVDILPKDFYSTRFYTEKMIELIDGGRGNGKPFFAYLAHTSPHWPLQAPQESIAKYLGKYDQGYDALNRQRLSRLIELGLFERGTEPFPRMLGEASWEELSPEEQRYESKKMAIYAAMVHDVDVYVGKIIGHLKDIGEYENTLIFFMSDNGPEGANPLGFPGMYEFLEECCDNSYDNIGNPDSYVFYGANWAQAGNTPLRSLKAHTSQGGIRAPAFLHYPKGYHGGRVSDAVVTVKDVMPTILEIAGIVHPGPGLYRGRDVVAMQGRSMEPLLNGSRDSIREPGDYMGWELFGRRGIRQGDWKLIYVTGALNGPSRVPIAVPDTWQLYNLAEDPTERNDLARERPGKLTEMLALWKDYATRNGVIVSP